MKTAIKLAPIPLAILAFVWYAVPAHNGGVTEIYHRPAKIIYDSLPQETDIAMNNGGCIMAGRIRSRIDGACYKESRLPEKQP